jgi:hypothetical protein
MARNERRSAARVRLKVLHRHRIGRQRFRRVSELVFVGRQPKTIYYEGETSDPRYDELPHVGTALAP